MREVKNLEDKHSLSFFDSLHSVKEYNGFMVKGDFPILIETSDNLWMQKVYVDTSNSAFDFYYMPPMPYIEGKEEMVDKYGLFDGATYDYLYSHFGGHVRLYAELWNRQRESNVLSKRLLNSYLMHLYNMSCFYN